MKRIDGMLWLWHSMSLLVLVLHPPFGDGVSLQVYVNARVEYGQVTSIVLSIRSLPSKRFGTRIITSFYNYLIENFVTSPTDRQLWQSTNDLAKVLTANGIQTQRNLEYRRCVYHVAKATFYSVGNLRILVETYDLRQADNYVEVLLRMSAGTRVHRPSGRCVPVVKVPNCGGPMSMLKPYVSSSLTLKITVQDNCKQTAAPTYRWTIYDVAEKEALRFYPATRETTLTINNFNLKCNRNNVVDQCAVCIRLEGTIADVTFVVRCYANVQHGRVHAEILGGRYREVNTDVRIRLDGRQSRDLTYLTGARQTLYYVWDCTSATDVANRYCKREMSTDGVVSLPAGSLSLDQKYSITLTVSSDHDGSRVRDTAEQLLSVVANRVINAAIVCRFNCELDLYTPSEKVHLEGRCIDCGAEPLDYDWQIEGVSVSTEPLLVAWLHTSKDQAYVDLSISTKNGGRRDQLRKVLHPNFGPKKGKCSIAPTSGEEVLTKFEMLCLNFSTSNPPLLFYLIAQKVVIRVCRGTPCPVPLPVTNGLTVRICDTLRVCVEDQVPVEVTPYVRVPENAQQLQQMLHDDPHLNVSQLLQQGKRYEAYIVLNSLAAKVGSEPEARVLLDCLADYQPYRGSEVGKLANITRTLAESLQPLSTESTKTLTAFLKVLNDNFARVHERGLLHELGLGPYLNVAQAAVSLLSIFRNITESLPLPPKYIYELAGRRPLTESLVARIRQEISLIPDAEALERSTVWLNATWQLDRLFYYLGLAGAQHLKPDEDLLSVISESVALELSCRYVRSELEPEFVVRTQDGIHEIVFSAALLQELSVKLDSSYICLKVISVLRNLYWWYPEERQPSSRLLTVRAYAREDVFSHELALKNQLNFMELLGRYKPAERVARSRRAVAHAADGRVRLRLEKVDWSERQSELQALRVASDADDDLDDTWLWRLSAHANVLAHALAAQLEATAAAGNAISHKQTTGSHVNSSARMPRAGGGWLAGRPPFGVQPRTVEDEQRIATTGLYINCIVNDSMHTYETTHIYRALLDPHTMLAIRFMRATHAYRVLIRCKRPNRLDISRSACIVPAGSTNRTIMVLNRSARAGLVYMGLRVYTNEFAEICSRLHPEDVAHAVESGPALYSFVFQMRACDYWVYSAGEQYWSQYGCAPIPQANVAKGMYCNCSYLSTYTAYVWNVVAIPVVKNFGCSYEIMPTNSVLVVLYALLWSAFVLLLLLLCMLPIGEQRHVTYNCDSLVDELHLAEPEEEQEPHLLIVELSTGGHPHAGTTANVSLVFQTISRHEMHFTLYQDPVRPVLRAHTTYTVRLYTRDIRLPTKLAISHDNNGRYPRWLCRSIVLYDLQTRQRQEFKVERWILGGQLLALTAPLTRVGYITKVSWGARFRRSMELNCFNWFMFQPLFGMWRTSPRLRALTRFERICIWTAKFAVTFCAAAMFYGRTTIDNYELEREKYANIFLPMLSVLFLACICFVCATGVHYGFEFVLVPFTDRFQ